MENILFYYLLLINIISFIIIYIDKQKAIKHKWRIKESTLFLVSIMGGSIGTLIGMYTFRHKTKHLKFTIGIPLILILQILFFSINK
ncbi:MULTISPECIES: DUF1294 domain-containing protein [unclassified Clostridium]|jgi:phosphoesterase|uniref:DUF1294 domain-containing protein n=1 Tax=unclassified Clostridium TaxID=2614128 RepID=UPI0025BD284F|nr:DUF1294 domain-containing protein [Clostridium sp.]MCI6693289.1 DUF1294 domain-containing protein [Clostridium sp.]MDY2631106.1 DUF1294 domain-containing protein [Clostridium sp.]MDY4251832.1 DUF1294 domain-containing protein [Clostridium sp.]MDY6227849.1 DUF1294 domain-containing protein [Clostridium sp.]